MEYQKWIEQEAKEERREQRRATAHEHRFAPGVCDILAQTPQETQNELDGCSEKKTWCDLEEDCEE